MTDKQSIEQLSMTLSNDPAALVSLRNDTTAPMSLPYSPPSPLPPASPQKVTSFFNSLSNKKLLPQSQKHLRSLHSLLVSAACQIRI